MRMKKRLWTLLLILLSGVAKGNAGECQKPVPEGDVVLSNSAILKNNFPDGSEVILECSRGYVVDNGSATIRCVAGEWTKQELTCKKKDCGVPSESPNMHYNMSSGTLLGAYIKPICDRGYKLYGSSYRQCLSGGWSGRSWCQLVTCGELPTVNNSIPVKYPTKKILEFGDVIEYSCEEKYTLVGNVVICQDNGQFSRLPECKGECQKPVLEDNVVLSNSTILKNKFLDGSEVTLECSTGHVVGHGTTTIRCVAGEWSKRELKCKRITCGELPKINHSVIVNHLTEEFLEFEDIIEYSCKEKYTLVGNRSVVCQENGQYSSLPECKEMQDYQRNATPYILGPVAVIVPCICICIYYLQKRKGSYDTGEEKKTSKSLTQGNCYSFIT